jgi:hypothetical protein
LRFVATLDADKFPDDADRSFILSLRLSDNFVSVFEPPVNNSGIQGGTILAFQLVPRAGCNKDRPEWVACLSTNVRGEQEQLCDCVVVVVVVVVVVGVVVVVVIVVVVVVVVVVVEVEMVCVCVCVGGGGGGGLKNIY